MGLREDAANAAAEAAREQARKEQDKLVNAQQKRDDQTIRLRGEAQDFALLLGFEIAQFGWDDGGQHQPQDSGFRVGVLLCRSDDGVWMRFYPERNYPKYTARFSVVDACPVCQQWVERASHIHQNSLDKIGRVLAIDPFRTNGQMDYHHRRDHGRPIKEACR